MAAGSTAIGLARAFSAGDHSRPDLPILPTKDGKVKASAAVAREIADSADLLREAVKLLERDFYANSGRDSAKSKRRFVLDLAELVLSKCISTSSVLPLTSELVTKVAA